MNKYVAGLIVAAVAAATGFVIHVASQDWLESWVSAQMQGHQVAASWDVRYLALVTSLEIGVGLVILYALVRSALPAKSSVGRGLMLAILLLAVMGRLVRQPVMNLAIGNPLPVVAVQDGTIWLLWLCVCLVVAAGYDFLVPRHAP